MNGETLLIHLDPKQGYNKVFDLGEYGMKLTAFGVIQLARGTSYQAATGEFEVALVLLGGKCAVKGDGFDFAEVGGRKNVFDGKPHTVYLPRRTAYEITALTDVDLAYNASPATRDTAKPCVITPEMTRELVIGRDNFTRKATVILDEKFDSEHFYIGEGMASGTRMVRVERPSTMIWRTASERARRAATSSGVSAANTGHSR